MKKFKFRWSSAGAGRASSSCRCSGDSPTPYADLPGLAEPKVSLTDLPPGADRWRVIATRFKPGQPPSVKVVRSRTCRSASKPCPGPALWPPGTVASRTRMVAGGPAHLAGRGGLRRPGVLGGPTTSAIHDRLALLNPPPPAKELVIVAIDDRSRRAGPLAGPGGPRPAAAGGPGRAEGGGL